ncbi:kinase-like protein [Lojkania enalia]|uniref:Kinase-like protein n=1 Tax=Lojkania enalia TaxID=147567 RepID=A0A9P4N656_9PLEO|nr:kinase-like protein [Didymosphaeria enalia]
MGSWKGKLLIEEGEHLEIDDESLLPYEHISVLGYDGNPLGGFAIRIRMLSDIKRGFGRLANGLAFIHKNSIRHRDIKPQNILVHKGRLIYTDFGIAHDYTDDPTTTQGQPDAFTRKYCAPEDADWGPRNSKSDILFSRMRFPGDHRLLVVRLIVHMLELNSELRPSAAQIVDRLEET